MSINLHILQEYQASFPQISGFPELLPLDCPYLLLTPSSLDIGLVSRDEILKYDLFLENMGGGILEVNQIILEEEWMKEALEIKRYEGNLKFKETDRPIRLELNIDTSKLKGEYKGKIAFLTNSPNNCVELPICFKVLTKGCDVKIRLKEGNKFIALNERRVEFGSIPLYDEKETPRKVGECILEEYGGISIPLYDEKENGLKTTTKYFKTGGISIPLYDEKEPPKKVLSIENNGTEMVEGKIKINCDWLIIDKYKIKEGETHETHTSTSWIDRERKFRIKKGRDRVEIELMVIKSSLKKGSHNKGWILLNTNSSVPGKKEIILEVKAKGGVDGPIPEVSINLLDFGKIYWKEKKTEVLEIFNIGKDILKGRVILNLKGLLSEQVLHTQESDEFEVKGDEESLDNTKIELPITIETQDIEAIGKLEGTLNVLTNSYLKERESIEIPVRLEIVSLVVKPEKIEFGKITYEESKSIELSVRRSDDKPIAPSSSIPTEYQQWIEIIESNPQEFKITFKAKGLTEDKKFETRIKIEDKDIPSLRCEIPFFCEVIVPKISIEKSTPFLKLAFEEVGFFFLKIKNEGNGELKIYNVILNKYWMKLELGLPRTLKKEEETKVKIMVDTNKIKIKGKTYEEKGKIVLISNDPRSPSLEISLNVSVAVNCPLKWNELNFGKLIYEETKELVLEIKNVTKKGLKIERFVSGENWIELPPFNTPIELPCGHELNFSISINTLEIKKLRRIQSLKCDIKVILGQTLEESVYSKIYPEIMIPIKGIVKFKRWWVIFCARLLKLLILAWALIFTTIFLCGIITIMVSSSYRSSMDIKLLVLTGILGPWFLLRLFRK